ncbi:MAG: DUF1360 domain-containing protein [Paenibacillus sp.]|uniref:Sporulation protein YjcA n=1 Tax=Paenibacillus aquistagni TaxID=1852522 RepID=A0A1X7I208_9BACL|nr:DUF1360 domain-containing protein [Paenibacillus aquistagni]MBR2568195.1 DUF1360 domain-containing protein [Paenibacillus sp.]NMM51824.1 DUF1360 domain-containing protein [Paenibacillus aquistagni]SMG07682.1 Protein of unknown function [Paenibacillus aquistagni]
MWTLDGITFLLLFLAAYRLTRLIVFDDITSFIRKPFIEEKFELNDKGMLVAVIEQKGGAFHRFMGKLLSCYWCTGVWASAAVVLLYLVVPDVVSTPLIWILAIAGAAGILESFVKG